jgi:hypothetical protein
MRRPPPSPGQEAARQLAVPDMTRAAIWAGERPATSRMLAVTAERTSAHVCVEVPPAPDVVAIGVAAAARTAYPASYMRARAPLVPMSTASTTSSRGEDPAGSRGEDPAGSTARRAGVRRSAGTPEWEAVSTIGSGAAAPLR